MYKQINNKDILNSVGMWLCNNFRWRISSESLCCTLKTSMMSCILLLECTAAHFTVLSERLFVLFPAFQCYKKPCGYVNQNACWKESSNSVDRLNVHFKIWWAHKIVLQSGYANICPPTSCSKTEGSKPSLYRAIGSVLGFAGYTVSVATAQLFHCNVKGAVDHT